MSLKNAVMLIMGLTILLIVGLSAAVIVPMARSFAQLEDAHAHEDSRRVQAAIAGELRHLTSTGVDWSAWDDTYAFVQGEYPDYVAENLDFATMANLGLNVMYFYDSDGAIVWGKVYDIETEEEIALETFAPGALSADDVLLRHETAEDGVSGLLATAAGPLLTAALPILPSTGTGEPRGTLIVGSLLDGAKADAISDIISVGFDMQVVAPADATAAPEGAGGGPVLTRQPGAIVSHTVLQDIYGQPLLSLTARTPREISAVGDRTVQLALLSLLVIGLVDLALMWLLLQRLVLRRVERVTGHVVQVAKAGLEEGRVPVQGKDELGVLAREFNRMLDRLAEARKQLVEQSHQSGMSEMAAGVLHNLRNGLVPLVGRLEALVEKLRAMPGSQLGQAVAELADPATEEARRRRLLDYVAATGASFAATKDEAVAELTAMTSHARKLGEIVKHQDKFIYSRSVVQPTDLREAILDAVGLLPQRMRDCMAVTIDPSVGRAPVVLAEPIALIQIFHNLLLNAAEAIEQAEGANGAVTVSTVASATPGQIDVIVADNGIGIAAEQLPQIFARGYTTKPSGAGGLGLHWCANAAGNMQGRLNASSQGRGKGATFRLSLPAAEGRLAA